MKKFSLLLVSLLITGSILGNVYADTVNFEEQRTLVYITDENETITPYVDLSKGTSVSTSNSTWTSSTFTIPSDASYFNVDFKNDTDIKVNVKIMDSNGTYNSFEVEANDQKYLKVGATGEYYIQIDKEGGNIKGTLRVAYY